MFRLLVPSATIREGLDKRRRGRSGSQLSARPASQSTWHAMQRVASGTAASRSSPIGFPHDSQTPYVPSWRNSAARRACRSPSDWIRLIASSASRPLSCCVSSASRKPLLTSLAGSSRSYFLFCPMMCPAWLVLGVSVQSKKATMQPHVRVGYLGCSGYRAPYCRRGLVHARPARVTAKVGAPPEKIGATRWWSPSLPDATEPAFDR